MMTTPFCPRRFTVISFLLGLVLLGGSATAQETKSTIDDEAVPEKFAKTPWAFDGEQAHKQYDASIARALADRKFQELEDLGAELRAGNGLRFTDGRWKLSSFHSGLYHIERPIDAEFEKRLALLDEWKKQNPNSVVEPITRANVLKAYGWSARGTRMANTVTEEGWKLLAERLKLARQVLMDSKERSSKDPAWYNIMQTVALGQGWDRQDYDLMCKEAFGKHPDYYQLYSSRSEYLQPKWFGKPGEASEFELGIGKEMGAETYTRLIWFRQTGDLKQFLAKPDKDWKFIRSGWEEIMAKYPDSSWNLNSYAQWAVAANDRPLAKRLLNKIGDHYSPGVWKDVAKFSKAIGWANEAK